MFILKLWACKVYKCKYIMYINFAYYFTKLLFNNTCNYFNHYWKHYCYYKIEFYINLQDQIHSMLQGTTFFSLPQFYWGWEKYIRKTKTQNSKEILIFFSRAFTWIIRGLISMYFTKKKKKETIMFLQGNCGDFTPCPWIPPIESEVYISSLWILIGLGLLSSTWCSGSGPL